MKGYDIQAIMKGTLSEQEIQLSSFPPLPNEDLLILLTTGSTPEDIRETGVERAALSKLGSYVGEQLLNYIFSSSAVEGGPSFAERFTLAIGEERTRRGSDTIRVDFLLQAPFYIQGEKDPYDDFNCNFIIKWKFK